MSAYKIFISSPGDVGRERHLAEQVIRRVAAEFQNRVEVQPYFWEYEPMESTRDYQENIPLTSAFDLVICILWKRLGSPLSVKHQRPEGGCWRSGTEFELATAVESKKARGAPDVFIFKNDTKPTFEADEAGEGAKTELDLAQWKALIAFIKEWCEGMQDGQRVFTAALNRYQALDQFEQVLEKLLVGKLNERFPPALDPSDSERTGLRPAAPTWTQGSPFRGLEAFQFLHAAVFCGHTHAIGEVLERLRRKAAHGRPFVLILGASGSGKSSLAMAGVLPLLVKPGTIEGVGLWRRVVFRPGGQTEVGDLFDRLAAALVQRQQEGEGLPELISGSTTVARLAADLRADPKAAALLVRSALDQVAVLYREAEAQKLRGWIAESQAENRLADVERYGRLLTELTPREARLALVIDQAEELFTSDDLNRRPELQTRFAVALDALAASGFVFVLATLRSDFYSQIQQLPSFVDLKEADGQFDLLPAQPAEIAQMIRQPALAAGLRFEQDRQTQEGLDEVLAYQVEAEPRLLPLLEFALDELYKQRSADGLLTFEAYRVHLDGSIVRALAKRADATLEGLPELSRDAFRSVMRRLATMLDDRAAGSAKGPLDVIQKGSIGPTFQRQRVPYDQLTAHPPGAKALVDAFVAARLLVVETGKADEQKAEVTVAHEALFEHWAALKNLLLAERDDLILPRARVGASHELWLAENRAGDFLLPPGKQLSEAEQLLEEYGEELTPELKAYIAASMAQAHAQQKRRQRLLISILAVFALLAVAASAAAIFGFWQATLARASEKKTGQVASHSEYLRGCELIASGDEDRALSSLAHALELSAANREAATRLINLLGQRSWPRLIATLQHAQAVERLAATPDGRHLFVAVGKRYIGTADSLSAVHAWDLDSLRLMAPPQVDPRYTAPFKKLTVNASGDRVMAFRQDLEENRTTRSLELFDAHSGRMIARWGALSNVDGCVFSNDGNSILYWRSDLERGAVRMVSAATGNPVRTIPQERREPTNIVMAELIGEKIYILDENGRLISQSPKLDSPSSACNLSPTSEGEVDKCTWARVSPDKQSLYGLFENKSGDNSLLWYIGRWRLADGKNERLWHRSVGGFDLKNVDDWNATFDATGQLTLVGKNRLEGSSVVLKTSGKDDLIEDKLPWQSISLLSPRLFLAANGNTARIISSPGGTVSGAMRHDAKITAVCAIGNDGFATGDADGEVKIWKLVSPALHLQQVPSIQTQKYQDATKPEVNQEEYPIADVSRDGSMELRIGAHSLFSMGSLGVSSWLGRPV
jgi:hypothetical protein